MVPISNSITELTSIFLNHKNVRTSHVVCTSMRGRGRESQSLWLIQEEDTIHMMAMCTATWTEQLLLLSLAGIYSCKIVEDRRSETAQVVCTVWARGYMASHQQWSSIAASNEFISV